MAGETIIPHAVVTVDGVARPASKVRVTRELATDMPAQVAAGGGMVAATASVTWANDVNGVQDTRADILKPNSRVTIDAGMAGATGALSRRFTGKLDVSSGTASDGGSGSSLVDDSSRLDRAVTTPCHFSQEVSGVGISYVGLGTPWLAYEVARQCGMSAYHYSAATTMLWASLAGSTLPSNAPVPGYADGSDWSAAVVPDGVGIQIQPNRFIEFAHNPVGAGSGVAVEASIWTDVSAAGYVSVAVRGYTAARGHAGPVLLVGNGQFLLYWQELGALTLLANGFLDGGWQPVAMHMTWGSAGWDIRVRCGTTVYGPWRRNDTAAYAHASDAKWATLLQVNSGETVTKTVAGLVVDRHTTTTPKWAEHGYTPRFKYEANPLQLLTWLVMPPQDAVQGMSLMKDMTSAELAGLWVDEDGVLRYRTRTVLRDRAVSKTVTSAASLIDYSWSYSLDSVRKRVIVKWRRPVYTIRRDYTLPVWESGDQTWKQTDPDWQQFVEPDGDEDWLDVDLTFTRGTDKQRNTSSWWTLQVKDDATNNVIRDAVTADFTLTATGLGGTKARTLLTMAATTATGSSNYLAGKVVLNARGKATWTDETTYSDPAWSALAPDDAPDLVHDVGWMMQSPGQATTVSEFLAKLLMQPLVEVDDLDIVPDPTLRLGDKIRVEDQHVKGWAVEGVVSRIDEEWGDGSASMRLGLRVTKFDETFLITLAQLDRKWAGASLGDVDAVFATQTLGTFDAYPYGNYPA